MGIFDLRCLYTWRIPILMNFVLIFNTELLCYVIHQYTIDIYNDSSNIIWKHLLMIIGSTRWCGQILGHKFCSYAYSVQDFKRSTDTIDDTHIHFKTNNVYIYIYTAIRLKTHETSNPDSRGAINDKSKYYRGWRPWRQNQAVIERIARISVCPSLNSWIPLFRDHKVIWQ